MSLNWWDDFDDASANLAAVLEFMDEYDARDKPKPKPSKPIHSQPKREPPAPKRRASVGVKPAPAKNPRKEEMRTLQAQAASLEIELHRLQENLAPPHVPGAVARPVQQQEMMRAMWKDMAMRQRKQREQAERENERLRGLLEKKAKLVGNLQQLFDRQPRIEDVSGPVPSRTPLTQRSDSAAVFRHLEAYLPLLFEQLDAVFTDARLDTLETSLQDVQTSSTSSNPQGDPTVEILNARILPFDVPLAAQALWDFCSHHAGRHFQDAWGRKVVVLGDLIKKEIHGCAGGAGTDSVELHGRFVTQRCHIQGDRVALICAGFFEPITLCGQPVSGVVGRAWDWIVLEKPRNPAIRPSAAQIEIRRVCSFVAVGNDAVARRNAVALMNFFSTHVLGGIQMLENMLFDVAQSQSVSANTPCAVAT